MLFVCYLNSPILSLAHEVKCGCSDVDGLADVPQRGQVASWQKMLLLRMLHLLRGSASLVEARLLHKPQAVSFQFQCLAYDCGSGMYTHRHCTLHAWAVISSVIHKQAPDISDKCAHMPN